MGLVQLEQCFVWFKQLYTFTWSSSAGGTFSAPSALQTDFAPTASLSYDIQIVITDSNNEVQEVRGLGVVGEQPLLKPAESFEYTSGAAIATPVGTMKGSYQMVAEDGVQFDAAIPEFTLSMPRVLH